MIDIDIIRKKRTTGSGSGNGSNGYGGSTGMATAGDYADRASEADHAESADNATHADSASELDGNSTVWATIRGWIANVGESVKDMFLRKDTDDETKHKLTMAEAEVKGGLAVDGNATMRKNASVGGHVTTDDARSSDSEGKAAMSGHGWALKNTGDDGDGYSILAVDNLVVRRKAEFNELEINKKTYVGGQLVVSDWGHKIWMMQPVKVKTDVDAANAYTGYEPLSQDAEGVSKVTIVGDSEDGDTEVAVEMAGDTGRFTDAQYTPVITDTGAFPGFKVWFRETDGTVSTKDDLTVGSMGMVQEFNVEGKTGKDVTNTYYWGSCVEHGTETLRVGGKETRCVYAVFGLAVNKVTLTSEADAPRAFSCFLAARGFTRPAPGDDMVGFGNADPWQDGDRSDVVVIASKDADGYAPGIAAYSNIGRLRGGVTGGKGDYKNSMEQYSLPSAAGDERLDARISRKAGNVFKGSIYFTGSDGKTPLAAKYTLAVSPSAVKAGGKVTWKVMRYANGQMSEVDMSEDTTENWTRWDVTITPQDSSWGEIVPVADGGYTFPTTAKGNYVMSLYNSKDGASADKTAVCVLQDQEIDLPDIPDQTVVWRLVPVTEVAEASYVIDKDGFADYTGGGTGSDEKLDAAFKRTVNISLQYQVVKTYGDGMTETYQSNAGGNNLSFTAYDKDGKQVGATIYGMAFQSTNAGIAYVVVTLDYGGSKTYEKRVVRVKLATNGALSATKDMLAYTYYGTDGETGIAYVNRHLSTMEGNLATVTKTVDGLETKYSTIKQTADEISLKVGKCATRQELLDTGIDISDGAITLTADKTTLQTNGGKKILSAMLDSEGNWTNVKVNADELTIDADRVNVSATHKLTITGSGAMVVDMDNFKLDAQGNASLTGSINSASGRISFFTFTESGMYSAVSTDNNGLGLRSNNISVAGSPGGRTSLVCLGDGRRNTATGSTSVTPTSLVDGVGVNYANLIQVKGGGPGNGRDAAALGIETDGDYCLSATGGLSHLQGLALDASTASGPNRTLFLCSGDSFTMPSNPKAGQLVIVIQTTGTGITFYAGGKNFRKGASTSRTAKSGAAGQWNFFVYDGSTSSWRCVYANGGLF